MMLQTQPQAPVSHSVISDYSPSPSPQTQIDSVDSSNDDSTPQQIINCNDKNLTLPSSNNVNKPDTNSHDEEESLHEMVQSILNDSDNDVVLNNLNGLGYNNIQYNTNNNNDNTALSFYRHPQINNPSISPQPLPQQIDSKDIKDISSQSAPQLHSNSNNKTQTQTQTQTQTPTTPSTKRKYVIEWRTLIFIRHGKSKWNAAEGNTIGKVVAAGQGLWEYYKNKKLREKNIKKQKSDVDIMDASLSREGIMEALQLLIYLRQYTTSKQLNTYNNLFEQTRNQINDIINNNNNNNKDKLQECLQMLDKYKIESLIQQHPPQDDDNLRLPQPVPAIDSTTTTTTNDDNKLDDINENDIMNMNNINSPPPPPIDNNNNNNNNNNNEEQIDTLILKTDSPSFSTSYQSLQDFNVNNNDDDNNIITKGNKKYMSQISDPYCAMNGEYIINLLNGNINKCGIVVSNLRRAMSTACICLKDRLVRRPYEKIQILGCLQEIGLNSDTRPLLFTKDHKPNLAKTEKTSALLKDHNMRQLYSERLSTKYYKGDASDKTAQQRLQEFALWLFAQRKYLRVIAIGHSHWFQSFFKAYLPASIDENQLPAKVRINKIRNCGVVAFRIMKKYVPSKSKRHGRHISFEIAPNSITTIQFSLYHKPITNHDNNKHEHEHEHEHEDEDEDEDENKEEKETLGLEQSTSTVATSLTDDNINKNNKNNNNNNNNNNVEQNIKEINEEKEKEKKSNGYLSNLSKPKNWMTRAIGRFGGGSSPSPSPNTNTNTNNENNDKENKKSDKKEIDENKIENKIEITQQSNLGWAITNIENIENMDNIENRLNIENHTTAITDDEDYIQ